MQHFPEDSRYSLIDYLRVLAIVLMVVYHFHYDLYLLGLLEESTIRHLLFVFIARSCACLFLFCVGYSIALNYRRNKPRGDFYARFFRHWLQVTIGAVSVSVVSYLVYPQWWIYFGILHCISVASLVALLFIPWPRWALISGLLMMILYWGWDYTLPWFTLDRRSLDYFALFPWLGMVLMGLGAEHLQLHRRFQPRAYTWIEWLSRHALWVYLLHQPVLLGSIWLVRQCCLNLST